MTAVYDKIGKGYDLSRKADSAICASVARMLEIQADGRYVDIGCGTGNYTLGISDFGGIWTGFDISATMLAAARGKSNAVGWCQASVESTPFAPAGFSGGISILAVHHFQYLHLAFCEISRILVPGGRWVIFTSSPEQMHRYWLNDYFPQMMARACAQMPTLAFVAEACSGTGLTIEEVVPFEVTQKIEDRFLYSGKFYPKWYLDADFRRGISSFSTQCDARELASGLAALQQDIQSASIDERIRHAEAAGGDYLFLRLQKTGDAALPNMW